jgi:hypothetical protein
MTKVHLKDCCSENSNAYTENVNMLESSKPTQ